MSLVTEIVDDLIAAKVFTEKKRDKALGVLRAKLEIPKPTGLSNNLKDSGGKSAVKFKLDHKDIDLGSVSGVIYYRDIAIQSFKLGSRNIFEFKTIGQESNVFVTSLSIQDDDMLVSWNTPPVENRIQITYELKDGK